MQYFYNLVIFLVKISWKIRNNNFLIWRLEFIKKLFIKNYSQKKKPETVVCNKVISNVLTDWVNIRILHAAIFWRKVQASLVVNSIRKKFIGGRPASIVRNCLQNDWSNLDHSRDDPAIVHQKKPGDLLCWDLGETEKDVVETKVVSLQFDIFQAIFWRIFFIEEFLFIILRNHKGLLCLIFS